MSDKAYSIQTRLLHNKYKADRQTGAVSVPVQHASTFHQFQFDTFGKYDYGRSGNPTREVLEDTIAELESGYKGFAFASGMAAISTVLTMLNKGDHILITNDVYGGTYRLLTEVLYKFGIDYTFVDMTDMQQVAVNIKPNTRLIYIETPSNPLLKVTDLQGVAKLAKANGCLTVVDNTFLTPVLQRPLELGADIVIHSATKFIAGHSDVIAGLVVVKSEEIAEQIGFLQNSLGSVLGAQDCWLVLRGLKTLQVRLEQSSATAFKLAQWLESRNEVTQVFYPGLTYHPGKPIQTIQASGYGAVLSFELEDKEAVKVFVEKVEIPVFAVSLGAVESILSYPATMSHAAMNKSERESRGITDGLLRLSVGLERYEDIVNDFSTALHWAGKVKGKEIPLANIK
ncbi:cystathionine beta-lyase [Alteribacter populi]|uniref:cystathionine beta-lyase n=1 Tax=Alteribacter populi TaxID=2011011 RepID=UPI000BBAD963|nr:cystathionine beta-lyase [Alteribacter populi]